ncbi:hypothetical protein [Halobacillus seohaensis]|uniref:hypothetical protein n=1 Tax=Halobacillus seohaensis TaxID=447421 RepID=UPI0036F3782C
MNQYFTDNTGWTNDYTKANNPDGNSDIKNWGEKENQIFLSMGLDSRLNWFILGKPN